MLDVAIVSLPRLDLIRPAIAPAILYSLATELNMSSKIFDFALETYEKSTKEEWNQYELYWQIDLDYRLEDHYLAKLEKLFDEFVDQIVDHDPKHIAISVFSHNSINATKLFLEKLRLRTQAK